MYNNREISALTDNTHHWAELRFHIIYLNGPTEYTDCSFISRVVASVCNQLWALKHRFYILHKVVVW